MGQRLEQLKQLGELLQAGVLTEAEFEQQKTQILNGL
jgi:Short C-terminal domain